MESKDLNHLYRADADQEHIAILEAELAEARRLAKWAFRYCEPTRYHCYMDEADDFGRMGEHPLGTFPKYCPDCINYLALKKLAEGE